MPLFFIDYWYLIIIAPGFLLSIWAASRVKMTFARFSQLTTRAGFSGAEVARRILRDNGIHDVTVEPIAGHLSDHYDPRTKTLRLSEPVYGSRSFAAFGVAAHEVGHAIQHAEGYGMLKLRSAWAPAANFGSGLSMFVLFAALLMGGASVGGISQTLAIFGVLLFATTTVFTLVTLPVEFDASKRALRALAAGGYMGEEELRGARQVLNAAAWTYVAAFVTSVLTLLYWAWRLGLFGGHHRDE